MDGKKKKFHEQSEHPTYLDIQAEVGITKHYGGYGASENLYKLCHLDTAEEVLDVGCGVGIGAIHIAKLYGCRVMAVDLSETMLEWAEKRVNRSGFNNLIKLKQADILKLPFEDNRYDTVIVESVLAFVEDKQKAIQEIIRVTKPGKYIGINESFWRDSVPAEVTEKSVYDTIDIALESELEELWDKSPLIEKTIKTFSLDAKQELLDRFKWIGCSGLLSAWARVIKLVLTRKDAREAIRQQLDIPDDTVENYGYGLYVGRKKKNI